MTHAELIVKAEERLRAIQRSFQHSEKVPPKVRQMNVDELPRRKVRDTVLIRFESDENRGSIEVVMDKETGEFIENRFIPPKE